MAVTYEQWLQSVDSLLSANNRGISAAHLDDEAMQSAFAAGLSPVVFAKSPNLPLKPVVHQAAPVPQPTVATPSLNVVATTSKVRNRIQAVVLLVVILVSIAGVLLYPRGISPSDRAKILNFLADEYATSKVQQDFSDLVEQGLDYNAVGPAELNLLSSKVKPDQAPARCQRLAEMATSDLQGEIQARTGKLIYSADRDSIRKSILADIGMSEPEFHQLANQSGTAALVTAQYAAAKGLIGQGYTGLANSPDTLKMFGDKNSQGPGNSPEQP